MGICPNCGSWVDEGDICGCCGGSESYSDDDYGNNSGDGTNPRRQRAEALSDEAWRLENDGRFEEALVLINRAIEINPSSSLFNDKAIILQDMCRYEEALEFYDRALKLSADRVIVANKARCIEALLNMKKYSGPYARDDLDYINEALRILPEGEDNYSFLITKGIILDELGEHVKARICYSLASKNYDKVDKAERQLEMLRNTTDTYIIVTSTRYYQNFQPFHDGVIMDLVKEPDNIHDRNAIRVEIEGETVGYVANSERTLIAEVKSATDIKDFKSTKAEFAFILLETYVIAKLI